MPPAKPAIVIQQDNATGRVSYWEGETQHSAADRNGVSLADYVHAIYGLLRQAKSRSVLMIGGAGGTLATMLARAGMAVTVVDIDPASFDRARQYFHLPDRVACHAADGAKFIRRDTGRYDAIVLDAYAGGRLPPQFEKPAFFADVRAHLKPRGILMVNLLAVDDDDLGPDRIAALMRKEWRNIRILDNPAYVDRNVVAMAGTVRKLRKPRLLVKPDRDAKKIAAEMKTFAFRKSRL
jgi:spermidine synthase